ncbi:MAG: hypothetical protein PW792_10215 [Acidobacteriaceae bacterium]|nr:hypothetical protein [Acidobacteriaceae bacterium]
MIDDVYKLCPPLFSLNALRVDSPSKQNREAQRRDAEFFKANPRRRLHLREAIPDEFDLQLSIGEWLGVPVLHVLVIQVLAATHLAIPVYRGRRFWSEKLSSDEEIGQVLTEQSRREGIDVGEWMMFELGQKQGTSDKDMVH